MEKNEQHQHQEDVNSKKEENNKRVVKINVEHHSRLFDFFENERLFKRGLLAFLLIVFVIALSLIILVLVVKSFFPYKTIETNDYGATIIKHDDKEIIYWLLNSADVWANSGIMVEKGEELTIRASGASHAAIHRLVDEAKFNSLSSFDWVDADGRYIHSAGDPLYGEFRLAYGQNENKLLMHIFPSVVQNIGGNWINEVSEKDLAKGTTFAIGHERTLIVPEPGVLHFAVNDILLTDTVIKRIYMKYVDYLCDSLINYDKEKLQDTVAKLLETMDSLKLSGLYSLVRDSCKEGKKDRLDSIHKEGLKLDPYPRDSKEKLPFMTELYGYKKNKFRDAWFVDNLGSFLIVIERKR